MPMKKNEPAYYSRRWVEQCGPGFLSHPVVSATAQRIVKPLSGENSHI